MILLSDNIWEMRDTVNKGKGIFVKKQIEAGTVIGDYIGTVIRTADEDSYEKDNGFYTMYYHDYASIYPTDVSKPGLHIINHSCTPNTWMYSYQGHTLYFAIRRIFPGEELTVSYLLSPLDETCEVCTHHCACESAVCTKTMHLSQKEYKKWKAYDDALSKKTKRKRIRYGKELPFLPRYPKNIPDHPIYTLFGSAATSSTTFTDKTLSSVEKIRKHIRETGRTLSFPALQKRVLGVQDEVIISELLE